MLVGMENNNARYHIFCLVTKTNYFKIFFFGDTYLLKLCF